MGRTLTKLEEELGGKLCDWQDKCQTLKQRIKEFEAENKKLKQSCKAHAEYAHQRLKVIREQGQKIKELEAEKKILKENAKSDLKEIERLRGFVNQICEELERASPER